jgi:hypothetical protein
MIHVKKKVKFNKTEEKLLLFDSLFIFSTQLYPRTYLSVLKESEKNM